MTEYVQTQLGVENRLRSAAKVRRLTPEQLGIPSGESGAQTAEDKWDVLVDAARDALGEGDIAAAVRTEDGTVATGIRLEAGQSHPVHALELAVWKAYSESESPVVKAVVVSDDGDTAMCGRCLQVVRDFSLQVTPTVRMIDEATGEVTEQDLGDAD